MSWKSIADLVVAGGAPEVALVGDGKAIVGQMNRALEGIEWFYPPDTDWHKAIAQKSAANAKQIQPMIDDESAPTNYYRAFRDIAPWIPKDAIIIGAGQSGPFLAARLAGEGWSVALVERGPLGGTCINNGCTPTKALIASARVAHMARRAADFGIGSGPVAVDFKLVSMGEREVIGTMAHVFATDLPVAVEQISSDLEAWARVAPTVYPLEDVVRSGLDPMSRGASPQIKVLFDPSIEAPRPLRTDNDD